MESNEISTQWQMTFLDISHLEKVLSLQKLVHDTIIDKRLFVPDPEDFIRSILTSPDQGKAIGVFSEDNLIAFRTISFPKKSLSNLGRDLHLSPTELLKVAHLESTVVHPEYRGNRLQAKMLKPSLEYIRTSGYQHVFATISPYNYPSLSTIIKAGFVIKDLKNRSGIYKGKARFLLYNNLTNPISLDFIDIISISHTDIKTQKEILKQGYVGFKLQKSSTGYEVLYGR